MVNQGEHAKGSMPGAHGHAANQEAPIQGFSRGSQVGRYVVLDRVGSGGFGDVYAAYDPDLDRKIAVKIMKTRENKLGTAREQLSREAQALAKLSHKNVLTVYDFGDVQGDVFLAMEFVDGNTLKEWFAQEERSWNDVLEVMMPAGEGLAAAHHSGLVHSDFKPQNVLIDREGEIRVADFGLAKALIRSNTTTSEAQDHDGEIQAHRETMIPLTREGQPRGRRPSAAGSPAYMAPEQFRGCDVNELSDQFSYAVTLFEGLYGRRPYPQRTIRELKAAVLAGAYDPPPDDSTVPRWLRDVVLKGIAQAPEDRFTSMDEFLAALRADPAKARKRMVRTGGTLGITALMSAGLAMVLFHEPTNEEQQRIEALRDAANAAAAANYYVMPPVEDPEYKTAYKSILALEDLDGGYDPMADKVAAELRESFSGTLTRIGDYYWSEDYGKTFALDYYMHAYMLDPSNERAKERAAMTHGEFRQARKKAKESGYTKSELIAAEPLSALAARSPEARLAGLKVIKKRSRRRSFSSQQRLDLMTSVTEALAKKSKKGRESGAQKTQSQGFDEALPASNSSLVKETERALAQPPQARPSKAPASRTEPRSRKTPKPNSSKEFGEQGDRHRRSSISASEGAKAVMQGRGLLGRAKFKEATQAFHRALKANRKNSAALMGLSDTYFELGQYRKAVDYGERAVKVNPRASSYRWKLGDAYVRVLRYDDAAKQYKKGAKLGSLKAKRRLKALKRKLGEK